VTTAGQDVQFPFDPCRKAGPCPGPARVCTPRSKPCAYLTRQSQICICPLLLVLRFQATLMIAKSCTCS
jgi:hypothetical protein